MKSDFATAMGRALGQVRAGDPALAMRTIQAALGTSAEAAPMADGPAAPPRRAPAVETVEEAEIIEDRPLGARRRLRDVVGALGRIRSVPADVARPAVARDPRLQSRSFSGPSGARDYRLYVPAARPTEPRGLVLMLHGCTQDPDDFAAGTRMNDQADREGLIVAYPHQTRRHNAQGCWNWFRPADQEAHAGEPAVLAALARSLAEEFSVPEGRIFVAGLSAGGAMAATLATTHPDLFAAAGIHSGLAHGAAHDVISAFAAMRGEGQGRPRRTTAVPTIIFHGTADATVHPANAEAILAGVGTALRTEERGRANGRAYRRERLTRPDGRRLAELWRIEGAGHAWSGGSAAGSFADPSGPDASAEMVRFFLEQ